MTYDPQKHHRRSIRLRGYDYRDPGAYFVTICTDERRFLFGETIDAEMRLNDVGQAVQWIWNTIPERFPTVELDQISLCLITYMAFLFCTPARAQ